MGNDENVPIFENFQKAFDDEKRAVFCECKWNNELVEKDVLNDLIEQSKFFFYKENYYYLFAKNGFTEGCIRASKGNKQIRLITFKEMNQ